MRSCVPWWRSRAVSGSDRESRPAPGSRATIPPSCSTIDSRPRTERPRGRGAQRVLDRMEDAFLIPQCSTRTSILFGWAILAASSLAFAQVEANGSVTGVVTDPRGLALPGVTVSLSGPEIIGYRAATTDESGSYQFRIVPRSEEHTSELQSPGKLVCRLLLEK